ncbi:MAG: hypothetical protein EBS79_13220 [Gammaproteobacteria bacterium]|nr:hypothetical protein [Gammaproteobacteria bacterium]
MFIIVANSFNKGSRQNPYYIVRARSKGKDSTPQIDSAEPQIALDVFMGLRGLKSRRGVLSNAMVGQTPISAT